MNEYIEEVLNIKTSTNNWIYLSSFRFIEIEKIYETGKFKIDFYSLLKSENINFLPRIANFKKPMSRVQLCKVVYINDLNLEKTKLKERIINLVNLNKRKDTVKKRLRKCDWTKDELNRLYNGLQEYNNCGNNISRIINDFKYGFFLLEMSKTLKIILKITQKRTFLY
jgi:hypothetical protein